MADDDAPVETETTANDGKSEGAGAAAAPGLVVNAQYLKDLSFENPRAPHVLANLQTPPSVQVNVDVSAERLGEEVFEVSLKIRGEATKDEETVFMVESVFGGVFTVTGAPPETLRPILLIEAPRLLFPFARAIVADATRNGGYPPLLVNPVDFVDLYRRRMAAEQAAKSEPSADTGDTAKPALN
ncbi:MAG: protein-export chaperone SecB [Pseudomonadota bacterium]